MMASPASVHPTPSQPGGTSTTSFPQSVSQVSTPSVTAANGFRPSIPPKDSRVPAGEIDRLSSSKISNPLNGKSATGATFIQSLLPPPLPHPPIKGISNAQARTARKSAPSSSNRGDGYSTSSSSGGGRKSISGSGSGKNSKERKDRESLSISESPNESPISTAPGCLNLKRSSHAQQQTPLPIHSKQPQQAQKTQQESQKQKGAMVPTVPAPPAFGRPPTQTGSTKRPVSPTPISHFSSKPKRQKIATAKAAALANEPLMNADGSAVKKRKKAYSADKGKPRRRRNKDLERAGMFATIWGDHNGSGEAGTSATINVAAKPTTQPQRLPIPPPAYQHPARMQKQNALQGQQGKKDSPITPLATCNLLPSGTGPGIQNAWVLSTPSGLLTKPQNASVSVSSVQTPKRQKSDDVISIPSSPLESREEERRQGETGCSLELGEREQGNQQNMPITIDDVGSDVDASAFSSRSPEEKGERFDTDKSKSLDILRLENVSGLKGSHAVSDLLFTKCISNIITDDERKRVLDGIVAIVHELRGEASHTRKVPLISGTIPGLQKANSSPTLQGEIAAWLKHVSVLTDDGTIITFSEWKKSRTRFKGKFILPPDPADAKKAGGVVEQPEEPQLPENSTADENGCASNVEEDAVFVENSPRLSGLEETSWDPAPSGKAQEKTTIESPVAEKQKESCIPASTLQLVGAVSLPPESSICLQPEALASSSQIPAQFPEGQELSNPSNNIEVETDTSTVNSILTSAVSETQTSGVSEVQPPALAPGKRKRKIFAPYTVDELLNESRSGQDLQSQRIVGFNTRQQERNDPLLIRIIDLKQDELRISEKIAAISVAAGLKERDFTRRIVNSRVGTGAKADGERAFGTVPGLAKDITESLVNWEEYRKAIKELGDFQDDTRREQLRLADQAKRVAEERSHLIERRAKLRQIEYELETTPSSGTSEEGSVDTSGSTAPTTAPSSVNGSLDENQRIPPPVGMNLRTGSTDMSVGQELLRSMIPWAMRLQEVPVEIPCNSSAETAANQVKSKKKPNRKKKFW